MLVKKVILKAVLLVIRAYQLIVSPYVGSTCRFFPSCSEYAMIAIRRYGILKGAFISIKRILKCHPFHPGGMDPVP